jgi:hypothetical protein
VNHTAENHITPFRSGPPPCGWCRSAHVADQKCTCKELCESGWCAAIEEGFVL